MSNTSNNEEGQRQRANSSGDNNNVWGNLLWGGALAAVATAVAIAAIPNKQEESDQQEQDRTAPPSQQFPSSSTASTTSNRDLSLSAADDPPAASDDNDRPNNNNILRQSWDRVAAVGQQFRPLLDLFQYLSKSGIDKEVWTLVASRDPLEGVVALAVLARIQVQHYKNSNNNSSSSSSPAAFLLSSSSSLGSLFSSRNRNSSQPSLPTPVEAHRWMKYARAAYLELDDDDNDKSTSPKSNKAQRQRRRIAEYLDLTEIHLLAAQSHGDPHELNHHVRHFVAVDTKHRQVVWTIRGTTNLSELVADMAAFTRPFYGGQAHAEIANLTETLWDQTVPTLQPLLDAHPTYELILTGHSLGAGVASLLNILLHVQEYARDFQPQRRLRLGSKRRWRCVVYACPPVYAPSTGTSKLPEVPLRTCTHYWYGHDMIPFVSIHAARQIVAQLRALQSSLPKSWWAKAEWLHPGMAAAKQIHPDLVQRAAQAAHGCESRDGAPRMYVPAAQHVWLKRRSAASSSDQQPPTDAAGAATSGLQVRVLTPYEVATAAPLGIPIHWRMTEDHMPDVYETVLTEYYHDQA